MAIVQCGQTIKGRFRVEEYLGGGGMADVYRVLDLQRRVDLAMKVLKSDLAEDREFLRRFRNEALRLSKLQHLNIVRFYGLDQEGRAAFMLMEFIDGRTLKTEIFNDNGPMIHEKIWLVMNSICRALNFAHGQGYVHCDVKPANVMINRKGEVFLTDFGISREVDAATMTMVGYGAPAYMSPEQFIGADPAPSTDIYSLGITLYEMLTGGRRPFTGETAGITGTASSKIRWEHTKLKPPSPRVYNPKISLELESVVMKCLEKRPSRRYQNTMSLLADLQKALGPLDPEILKTCLVDNSWVFKKDKRKKISFIVWLQFVADKIPFEPIQKQPMLLLGVLLVPLLLFGLFKMLPKGGREEEGIPTLTSSSMAATSQPVRSMSQSEPTATVRLTGTPPACTRAGDIWIDPTDMANLVCVPDGDFIMGSKDENLIAMQKREELLYEDIYLDAFWVDQTEVSIAQFQQFVDETDYVTEAEKDHSGHTMNIVDNTWSINSKADWLHPHGTSQEAESDHPATQVTWNDAVAYCDWAGRTLPTEAQWEKAARGTNGYSFPFEFDDQYVYCLNSNFSEQSLGAKRSKDGCDDGYKYTAPVTEDFYCRSYLGDCASVLDNPYNLYNMLGNVTEWVLDDWNGKLYRSIESNNPVYTTGSDQKCMRGGSWGSVPEKTRPTNRDYDQIDAAFDTLGFRCVYNP